MAVLETPENHQERLGRVVNLEDWQSALAWHHGRVTRSLAAWLEVVPTTEQLGAQCALQLGLLQAERSALENQLRVGLDLQKLREVRVVRVTS